MTTKKTAAKKAKAKPRVALRSITKVPGKSAVKAALPSTAKKTKRENKTKVVRDSFTMPQNEYARIAQIKNACLKAKMHVKKSEVLRAGLILLAELNVAQLKRALGGLEKIKTGRPSKH
jgi:predicted lipoprotein with Yx(FWY)xxD motif